MGKGDNYKLIFFIKGRGYNKIMINRRQISMNLRIVKTSFNYYF